jgi:hypothetical protein
VAITLELTGVAAVAQRLGHLEQTVQQLLIRALEQHAEQILAASQPLVPVDTGLLRSTGVTETEGDTVTIRYGGHGAAGYAAKIEFDTTLNHPNGGQAFYLSEPFFAATATMAEHLAAQLRQMLGE